ncbi:alpha-xylosidase, partial [Lactobacillus paracasei]|uniref:TIM-barrel domain-containing protein n=1 Tax=Lacticaseibacillus paracasei TaxID=1597 RepID=UPI0013CA3FB9
RYPIGFSGYSIACWRAVTFQPCFTPTATHIGYTWWSHDIGGPKHGSYDPEFSLRWVQVGGFSPILRVHSSGHPFLG